MSQYVEALNVFPDNQEVRQKLCPIINPAFQQGIKAAERFETQGDFDNAYKRYAQVKTILDKAAPYNCPSYPSTLLNKRITQAKLPIAEKYYSEGEQLFSRSDYYAAIEKFKEVHKWSNPYKDTLAKISKSYYLQGQYLESNGQYRSAAIDYYHAGSSGGNNNDGFQGFSLLLYSLGNYFVSQNYCRQALQDYKRVQAVTPNYRDLATKINQAELCATKNITFTNFYNSTRRNIAGMVVGDFIYDEIRSSLNSKASRYLRIVEPEAARNNIRYEISGRLTQVYATHQGSGKRTRAKLVIFHTPVIQQMHKAILSIMIRAHKVVYYREYTDEAAIVLSGSIKVVDMLTGEALVFYNINSRVEDYIRYADITSNREGVTISEYLFNNLNANRDLLTDEALVRSAISQITADVVDQIIKKVDNVRTLPDPSRMTYKL